MRFRLPYLVLITSALLVLPLAAEEKPLAPKSLVQALVDEVSGEIAYRYTGWIANFDRIQASEGWREAAEVILAELKSIGYDNAEIEGWPSNGSRYYYTYKTPIGWRAKSAELWLLSPERQRLCSYEEMPLTLVKHSNSADVEAELIDVGTGVGESSYAGKDVRGKIVLATEYTGSVMREAVVKRGALGVVTWYPPEVRPGYPNMVRYTAIWPAWEERESMGFGFNVSKQQGWALKKMLDAGREVKLKAHVDAQYYDSRAEILTAAFPGTEEPEQEVMIIGHLCHPAPSANDNASGSGAMLEMARALKRMVERGKIDPPKRTVRFLWVPEFAGTFPYIKAHLNRTRNTLSVINCDMVGEDVHLTGGTFNITCTPDSMPSYLNDVVVNFTRTAERLNLRSINGSNHPFAWRIQPFSGGSDHIVFNDGALKVPSVMFGHGDTFHHTSLDTMDKVDSSELRRICFITLGSSYYLASAGEKEAVDMARLITRNGLGRLSADYYDAKAEAVGRDLNDAEKLAAAAGHLANVLRFSRAREEAAVLSTRIFTENPAVLKEIEEQCTAVSSLAGFLSIREEGEYQKMCQAMGISPEKPSLTSDEKEWALRVPVRSPDFVCPLQMDYLVEKVGEKAVAAIKLRGYQGYEALNFADGKRSVLEIARDVSAEFGPVNTADIGYYFILLEKAGLLRMEKK